VYKKHLHPILLMYYIKKYRRLKIIIKLYFIAVFLHANLPAISSPLQQSENNIVKAGITDGSYLLDKVKDESVFTSKDSTIIIERDTSFNRINTKLKVAALRLKQNTASIENYVRENDFNTDYCFMIDMSIPSGKNRFFVYNIKQDEIVLSSLVSHGSGSYFKGCNDQLIFSNMPNSNATSLGKYKIGNAYKGKYGLAYKLFGLDSTNNNAIKRAIVLHADNYIPNTETYPYHIFESAGCPAVSPSFLTELSKYIQNSNKPILLWIYN
jgi:L,D-transpeptidase catalytic domain